VIAVIAVPVLLLLSLLAALRSRDRPRVQPFRYPLLSGVQSETEWGAHLLFFAAWVWLCHFVKIKSILRNPLVQSPVDCPHRHSRRPRSSAQKSRMFDRDRTTLGAAHESGAQGGRRTFDVVHVVLKRLCDRITLPVQHLSVVCRRDEQEWWLRCESQQRNQRQGRQMGTHARWSRSTARAASSRLLRFPPPFRPRLVRRTRQPLAPPLPRSPSPRPKRGGSQSPELQRATAGI